MVVIGGDGDIVGRVASLWIETGDQMKLPVSKPFFEIFEKVWPVRILFQFLLNGRQDFFGILEIVWSVEPVVFEAAGAGASIRHAQSDLPSEAIEEVCQKIFLGWIG